MLPTAAADRKAIPVATGFIDYFPDAAAAVAELSRIGNDQHNPGKPLHWDRSKSTDEADCMLRHFIQRGTLDVDGVRHSAKVAWRAMALLQKEIEAERAKPDSMAAVVAQFQDQPGAASTRTINLWPPTDRYPESDREAIARTVASLEAATRQRAAHNADKNTRHGGLPVMPRSQPESKWGFIVGDHVEVNLYPNAKPPLRGVVTGFDDYIRCDMGRGTKSEGWDTKTIKRIPSPTRFYFGVEFETKR